MINYTLTTADSRTYSFSYKECKDHYDDICSLSDEEFMARLPEALHLACYLCFIKEIPATYCLSDEGIIHQLAHLLHLKDEPIVQGNIRQIRKQFEETLRLC